MAPPIGHFPSPNFGSRSSQGKINDTRVGIPDFNEISSSIHQAFLSQDVKVNILVWTCLVDSVANADILTRIFRLKSPNAAWEFFSDWCLPESISVIEEWTAKFETITIRKGEEPWRYFAQVDDISSLLDVLGMVKYGNETIRKTVRGLCDGYPRERRIFVCEENVSRPRAGSIMSQRYLDLPRTRGRSGFICWWHVSRKRHQ